MNYFEFYGLPVSFLLDEKLLRKKYLELGKQYHPDFYSNASPEKQAEILNLSTLNNKAFKTLGDFGRRMQYILKEAGELEEEEKYQLPQIFLMEMMDMNEILMDLQFDPDPLKKEEVLNHLEQIHTHLYGDIEGVLRDFQPDTATRTQYRQIKEYYYKSRYLLRIREQLDKFALPD